MPFCYFNPKKFLLCVAQENICAVFYYSFTWIHFTMNRTGALFFNRSFPSEYHNCSKMFSWYRFYMPKQNCAKHESRKRRQVLRVRYPNIELGNILSFFLCYHSRRTFHCMHFSPTSLLHIFEHWEQMQSARQGEH